SREAEDGERREPAPTPGRPPLMPFVAGRIERRDERERTDAEHDGKEREQVVADALGNEALLDPSMAERMGRAGADRDENQQSDENERDKRRARDASRALARVSIRHRFRRRSMKASGTNAMP